MLRRRATNGIVVIFALIAFLTVHWIDHAIAAECFLAGRSACVRYRITIFCLSVVTFFITTISIPNEAISTDGRPACAIVVGT